MARTALEVADIFRDHGPAWREANRGHVSLEQLKVMNAIERCRTAALGGHVARCENEACAHTVVAYNSCRNRHCPKCQGAADSCAAASSVNRLQNCSAELGMGWLAYQEPPLAAEQIDEVVSHCPHSRNSCEVPSDQEPHVPRGQALSKRDLDQPRIIGRQVSRKECDAVAGACRRSLRRLSIGSKCKPLARELAREPFGLGDKITLVVETDERWRISGLEPLAILRRSVKAKGDLCSRAGQRARYPWATRSAMRCPLHA